MSLKHLTGVRRIVFVGALGGMIAGMMMAMVGMIYGWASPQWVWWLSHGVLGMTAGLAYDVARRVLPAQERTSFDGAARAGGALCA